MTKFFATSLFDSELTVTLVDSGTIARLLFDEFESEDPEEDLSVQARRGDALIGTLLAEMESRQPSINAGVDGLQFSMRAGFHDTLDPRYT